MKNNSEHREEKFAMLRRWKESGLTQKQFCINENWTMNNFQYWLRQLRKKSKKPSSTFIKLESPEKNIPSGSVFSEIIFANGNRMRFYNKVEISQLKQLAI